MKNKKNKRKKIIPASIAGLSVLATALAACLTPEKGPEIDEGMVDWINEADTADAGKMAEGIREVDESRREYRRASSEAESRSIAESISIEESIEESVRQSVAESLEESAAESRAIAESIYREESRKAEEAYRASSRAAEQAWLDESYAAVVASVKESIATGGIPTGVMSRGKIVTVGDEAIPTIRRLFQDTVVLGNSRAKSVLDSGILTSKTVLYKWAAHMDEITEMVQQAAGLQRKKALFIMGINDVGYYMWDSARWKADYIKMINLFRSINPNAQIYLQEIIPIHEQFRYRWYNMDRVPTYNGILREIAAETGCKVVSATDFAFYEFLADDTGAHYNKQFHFYWAQTMANQMGLWEGMN